MADRTFLRPGVARASRPRRSSQVLSVLFFASIAGLIVHYLSGPALALARLEIEGNRHAHTRQINAALEPYRGRNLLLLNLQPVSSAVEKVEWVSRVMVSKEFPDALRISIEEKTPIALWRSNGNLFWIDASGRAIAVYDPREASGDLPIVTAPPERLEEAVKLLTVLQKETPTYAAALSEIWSLPAAGFGMMDSIIRVPIDVMPGDAPEKIKALFSLRDELNSRGLAAREIDLRFDRRVILTGAFGFGKRV